MDIDLCHRLTPDVDILNLLWCNVFPLSKFKYVFFPIDDFKRSLLWSWTDSVLWLHSISRLDPRLLSGDLPWIPQHKLLRSVSTEMFRGACGNHHPPQGGDMPVLSIRHPFFWISLTRPFHFPSHSHLRSRHSPASAQVHLCPSRAPPSLPQQGSSSRAHAPAPLSLISISKFILFDLTRSIAPATASTPVCPCHLLVDGRFLFCHQMVLEALVYPVSTGMEGWCQWPPRPYSPHWPGTFLSSWVA